MPDADRHLMTIFSTALDHEEGADRDAYLDRACGGDAALRARVESLLRAHDPGRRFLEPEPAVSPPTTDMPGGAAVPRSTAERAIAAGSVIAGRYKLLEEIGEGGMGAVWMAEQTEPVQRRVAVKLIKPGMDSRQVVARFEAERQALALMDHPHIARVLDGGATEDGRPFFVMELVKGTPITKYCDEKRLPVRERLALFADVCRAVQHAHQKGIIHRDLKPSNVLVAPYDGRPVVKVIDFGIAKATGQKLTEATLFTGFGAVVGTPEYMSPEQAEVNNADIDTRCDVYALGVLLYELLTGTTPLTRQRVKGAALLEVLRLIREEEPPRPSTRLSSTDELPSIAAVRGVEPGRLSKLVRGELDWIVMKALDKDRSRRYETANGFAMDVQRYLADEPVQAGPPSGWYRIRKFVRRHKGTVLATAALVATLLAGVVGTTAGLIHATNERDQKQGALTLLQQEQKRLKEEQGRTQEANQKLQQATNETMAALRSLADEWIETQLFRQTQPDAEDQQYLRRVLAHFEAFAATRGDDSMSRAIRAEGHSRVAALHYRLNELAAAKESYDNAIPLLQGLATEHPSTLSYRLSLANCRRGLANLLNQSNDRTGAEREFRLAITQLRQLEGEFGGQQRLRPMLLAYLTEFAWSLSHSGAREEVEALILEALALGKKWVEAGSESELKVGLARAHRLHGTYLLSVKRLVEAKAAYEEALRILSELAEQFPSNHRYRGELGVTYSNLFVTTKASADGQKAVEIQRQNVADFPAMPEYRMHLAGTLSNLAIALSNEKKSQEAEEAQRQALILRRQLVEYYPRVPDYRQELAISLTNEGNNAKRKGKVKEALSWFDEAIRVLAPVGTNTNTVRALLVTMYDQRASVLIALDRRSEAAADLGEAAGLSTGAKKVLFRARRAEVLAHADPAKAVAEVETLLQENALAADGNSDLPAMAAIVVAIAAATEKDVSMQEAFASRSVALLRTALAKGSFEQSAQRRMLYDIPEIKRFHQRSDFKALLAEVEARYGRPQ